MFIRVITEIEFDSSKVVAEFGNDCYGIQHPETGYVGIYVKDEDSLLQISDSLVKNPNKTGDESAKELWG